MSSTVQPLGQAGVSRNSFRNLLCCAFFRCAKFRAKFDMLSISLQRKFTEIRLRGEGCVRNALRRAEAGGKNEIQTP